MNFKKLCLIIITGCFVGFATAGCTGFTQNSYSNPDISSRALLVISIDGLKPDYVAQAEELNLDVPNLRELWENGAHATGVRGVLPTSTYPSHTTIITGVSPNKHGVVNNRPFDPDFTAPGRWFWYSEEILSPTLWQAAAENGHTVGSVSWPVSVGMADIHYNIPEFMGTRSSEDVTMTRALATPAGLMAEIEKTAGEYITSTSDYLARDRSRVRYTVEIMEKKEANFMTVHLTASDGLQHANGPFTQAALEGIEEIDEMVGELKNTFRTHFPDAVVSIVSDHGFAETNYGVRLESAFVSAGLITLESDGNSLQSAGVKDWIAMPAPGGGSSPIHLKNPEDEKARNQVKEVLTSLASDPANGISSILEKEEIVELGGTSDADFWVDYKPGYRKLGSLNGPLVTELSTRGTHGHSPEHPEMQSTFIISGKGVKTGINLGVIDKRNIAPTLAKVLEVPFPSAELSSLDIFEDQKK